MSYNHYLAAKRRMKIQRMAHRMLVLIRAYVADDPCAPNDPRHIEAVAIIEEITAFDREQAAK